MNLKRKSFQRALQVQSVDDYLSYVPRSIDKFNISSQVLNFF